MAASSQHLHLLNPSYNGGQDATFTLFPRLPVELRQRVWQYAVERHRLLDVEIEAPSPSGHAPPYSTKNRLNKVVSAQGYTPIVRGFPLQSKLLRISSESRTVALRFYRVHIPCHFQKSESRGERRVEAVLYFNPEYDFMQLRPKYPVQDSAVHFLHDLKAYDPQDVGLLNLALDRNGMTALQSVDDIPEAPARAALVETLSGVQQTIWVAHSHCGRAIMGPLDDFAGVGVRFNHSMPIMPITPFFDLMERDPRPVGPELKYVLTGSTDPRQMRVEWQRLLEKWEVSRAQPARERVLFSYGVPIYREQVWDLKTANRFLKYEQESWLGAQATWSRIVIKHAGKIPVEGPEELAKATRPAVGFWLFPAEALGSLEGDISRMKKVFDMTGHWPELALSHLC